MAGSLCYRIDAECVADATARQAAALLEAELNDVRAVLRDRPKEIARCIAWALDFEEAHREREPAQWIAAHGIASIEKEPAEIASDREVFLSDPERENARAKIRRAFERMQNEAAGQAAREAATPKSGRTS
jgi:F0F1-type ATP synthase epsilon subunit